MQPWAPSTTDEAFFGHCVTQRERERRTPFDDRLEVLLSFVILCVFCKRIALSPILSMIYSFGNGIRCRVAVLKGRII